MKEYRVVKAGDRYYLQTRMYTGTFSLSKQWFYTGWWEDWTMEIDRARPFINVAEAEAYHARYYAEPTVIKYLKPKDMNENLKIVYFKGVANPSYYNPVFSFTNVKVALDQINAKIQPFDKVEDIVIIGVGSKKFSEELNIICGNLIEDGGGGA